MSPPLQPLKLWGKNGPNPPKVAILLSELSLPHEIIPINDLADVKKPDYLAINPNGRLPAIYDPNTDITLWESGAILEYLVDQYDKEKKFSFEPGSKDFYLAKQWLHFQMSGQGPYYGQATHFKRLHSEKIPSAIERYVKEVHRVTGVLEVHLAEQGVGEAGDGPWIVGGKFSYVDVAWFTWQALIGRIVEKSEFDLDGFPVVKGWVGRMYGREKVRVVMEGLQRPNF